MALDALLDAIERLPAFQRIVNTLPSPGERLRVGGLPGSAGRGDARRRARAAAADALLRRRRRRRRRGGAMARRSRDAARRHADRALSAARRIRRGRAAHGGRRRARRDARAADARRAAHAAHDRARAAREDAHAARAAGAARRAAKGRQRIGLRELAEHLERIGFERVPMVEDVAQFSIRGGIFDVYSFGMAEPVRAEFWGDEIVDLRHFDLATQRSSRVVDLALVLPVDGQVQRRRGRVRARLDHVALSAGHACSSCRAARTSSPSSSERGTTRSTTSISRAAAARTCRAATSCSRRPTSRPPRCVVSASIAASSGRRGRRTSCFRCGRPEPIDRDIKQLKRLVRDGTPTIILCDNEGQAERLDELLADDDRGPSPAALSIGVLDGGFIIPAAASACAASAFSPTTRSSAANAAFVARAATSRRRRSTRSRSSRATSSCTSSTASGSIAASRRSSSARARSRSRSSSTRAAIGSTFRCIASTSSSDIARRDDVSEDAPPPRLHQLGGRAGRSSARRTRIAIRR